MFNLFKSKVETAFNSIQEVSFPMIETDVTTGTDILIILPNVPFPGGNNSQNW